MIFAAIEAACQTPSKMYYFDGSRDWYSIKVAAGLSNQEIADHLFLSVWTVRTYVTDILEKIEVDKRTQATLYALREG